jgi:hypothetical protein
MRQKRHDEMPGLKEVDSLGQAFGVIHIHADRRRNERRAYSDERHVDEPANDESDNNSKDISQQVWHEQFSLSDLTRRN